ncbi:hypothetical protein [Halorhodospira neutriphila]|uniref:Uncharacterized protein n=1 Tax=Halorhodospira neutriphila TaxID=168379 RepID=A0ABS1E8G3_9GAMM|nr:hypothetical protein [Halorhodospira neutriphila]MBK1727457.1 hypothetical protein [Halorhodospira neutriphila]
MSQDAPRPNRRHHLRLRLSASVDEPGYREAARRAREPVPAIDLVHQPAARALVTLLELLEQDRFEAPVLLLERGLDEDGTPFVHHENATAALGAACSALAGGGARARPEAGPWGEALGELLGLWLIGAAADFPEAHEGYLRDLARGMGVWMVPQGWGQTLLSAGAAEAEEAPSELMLGLAHEAVVERAPGLKLRTVRHVLEALDRSAGLEAAPAWRRAIAYVIGAELYQNPYGRLRAEFQAHHSSPASRHRRAVEFIEREAIPAYHAG